MDNRKGIIRIITSKENKKKKKKKRTKEKERNTKRKTNADDLPHQSKDQMPGSLGQIVGTNIHNIAANGRG